MRYLIIFTIFLASVACFTGCQKDGIDGDTSFINSAKVVTADKVIDISNDNSGKVTITPLAEGASSFVVQFGHGSGPAAEADVMPGHSAMHIYPEGKYTATIISKSLSGEEVTNTYPVDVTFRAPENLEVTTSVTTHTIKVSATAQYAASFMVYFGDQANEAGTPLAKGAELSHTYTSAGVYNVKVVALSGGVAQSEKTAEVKVVDPFGLPVTFDDPNINYFFGTFGGGQQFSVVTNPSVSGINTSAKVGKFIRGNEGWSGTYSPLDNPINMSMGKKIKVLVFNPDPALVGKKMNIELESGSTLDNGVAVLKMPVTKSGVWEELVFDFGTISAIPAAEKFGQLVLRFNDDTDGPGAIIYVDNFRQTN